jgi:FdhD protein
MIEPLSQPIFPDEADAPLEPVVPRRIVRFQGERAEEVDGAVIGEIRFTIVVDGAELVTLMCSPWKLQTLVLGFLYLEGLIEGLDDVELLRVCLEDRLAEVRLASARPRAEPAHRILTSGCGGGTSFGVYLGRIDEFRLDCEPRVAPGHLYAMMRRLYEQASLYRQARGCHASLLADARGPLVVAQDIGRHNTLDKIQGACLLDGIDTRGAILLSSGRISSEMLLKAAVMGVPIVCSRTSPTALAVLLGERLNVTVVGYIRQDTMNVYTHPRRIGG